MEVRWLLIFEHEVYSTMMPDLFTDITRPNPPLSEQLGPGSAILRRFALGEEGIVSELASVTAGAPFRYMVTPRGFTMSVSMTNCGGLGGLSDRKDYRYSPIDPETGQPWPAMPPSFLNLARIAASQAGFKGFAPDACLINRYVPGAKLSLHQDRDEADFTQPIVSVSLGLPAVFLFGGIERADKVERIQLEHGDVVVWGGPDRLRYHGIMPLKEGHHPALGPCRINLTFRKAG